MSESTTAGAVVDSGAQARGGKAGSVAHRDVRPHRPIEIVLTRLEGVRQTASGRWLARCPAHEDRSPSLSLREHDDGTLLVRCHAGCDTRAVMHALGLELRDLFPRRVADRTRIRDPQRLPARDALLVVRHEARVVQVIASDIHAGAVPDDATMARLALAMQRIDSVFGGPRA